MNKDKTEQMNFGDTIYVFFQRNRKAILISFIVLAAGVIFTISFFAIRNVMERNAIAAVETLEQKKNDLGTIDSSNNTPEVQALVDELITFGHSTFGYAAARAFYLAGDIYFSIDQWDKAEETWLIAAEKASKFYLAPFSYFNAAIAAEEQGKLENALEYYAKSLTFSGIFPAAARARFNIGRIHEERNEIEEAAEAYRLLIEIIPNSNWARLAHNRIIFIENN